MLKFLGASFKNPPIDGTVRRRVTAQRLDGFGVACQHSVWMGSASRVSTAFFSPHEIVSGIVYSQKCQCECSNFRRSLILVFSLIGIVLTKVR